MVYRGYIHKCNLRKRYKGGQLCGIQKVYSQMHSKHNLREDNSVVYRRYIHKCNLSTQYKGGQLCNIQRVYSQMQSKNTILGKTTLWYIEGIFTNAI